MPDSSDADRPAAGRRHDHADPDDRRDEAPPTGSDGGGGSEELRRLVASTVPATDPTPGSGGRPRVAGAGPREEDVDAAGGGPGGDETTVDAAPSGEEPDADRDAAAPLADAILAIDIGGTKFAAGIVDVRGELIDRARIDVERNALPDGHFENLATITDAMIERARTRHRVRLRAVGVGCAGPVTTDVERVSPVNIPAWRDFPLRARLADLTKLPVFGDLDAKALALAEGWRGAAQGQSNFCAITVSTGVGGGVVLDGELLDGASGNAGHIGHVIVEPGGHRCGCGAQGCLEAEASGLAIEAITGRPPTEPTYELMQRTGALVGRAAATVCNALDLSLVVVGGSVALGFAATFFHSAQAELDEYARLGYSRGARITPSRLADTGPLIGAGAVGWRGARRARRRRVDA